MNSDDLCGVDQHLSTAPSACAATDTAELSSPDAGTPLYDELAAGLTNQTLGSSVTTVDLSGPEPDIIQAAVVLDLFRRLKQIEHSDGRWSGGDIINVLNQWFSEFGIDGDNDDEVSAAQALRMPAWLARTLTAPTPHETGLTIHLRTGHTAPLNAVRGPLAALVQTLGEGTSAAVFDTVGDHIAHLMHPETGSTTTPTIS